MLKYLHIENIAVIEKAELELGAGFNCLTGETGAGKSIVIDAINAVLGERTSKDLIRSGCEEALVSAHFIDIGEKAKALLSENGIEPEDGGVVVTRKISAAGKGGIRINGVPVTASILRTVAAYLINIHGQHDSQVLLDAERHIEFVDAVADCEREAAAYYAEFKNLNAIRRQLRSVETDEEEKQHRIDLLRFQIGEIEDAAIEIGEYARLLEQQERLRSSEKISKALMGAEILLRGDEEHAGALEQLTAAAKQLSAANASFLTPNTERLLELAAAVEAVSDSILKAFGEQRADRVDADALGDRLELLRRLMKKYGQTEQEVLSFLDQAKEELEAIVQSERRAEELAASLDKSTERLIMLGNALTQRRTQAAERFSQAVCGVLEYLNMKDVRFSVRAQKGRYTKAGCDQMEFLISANAGEDPKPLSKIASGGELSRVMLAVKSVLLDKDPVDTLIFDEIDAGISGFTAEKVAEQLKKVSADRQVICVTHLAQIAAKADTHLLIEKSTARGRTYTSVRRVAGDARIAEIARMMSGREMTDSLYQSAKEMLDRSLD